MKNPRNEALRKIVRRIEFQTREIARMLRERRAEYRHAKTLGFDPDALRELIRERREGRGKTTKRRRQVARLRRIVR